MTTMNNDDNETERIEKNEESGIVDYGSMMFRTGFMVGLVGLLPITVGTGYILGAVCQKQAAAERAFWAFHEPVGNGGALSAAQDFTNGKPISERREKMYISMSKAYYAALDVDYDPTKTILSLTFK